MNKSKDSEYCLRENYSLKVEEVHLVESSKGLRLHWMQLACSSPYVPSLTSQEISIWSNLIFSVGFGFGYDCSVKSIRFSTSGFASDFPYSCKYSTWPKGRHQLKKNVFFRALPEWWGGGLPMPEFFGPLFRSAFLVNKKSLFLQTSQELRMLSRSQTVY